MKKRAAWALLFSIAFSFLIAAASVSASLAAGDDLRAALRSSSLLEARKLRQSIGMDSWAATFTGWYRVKEGAGPPYELAWKLDRCKFQYPPSALLLAEMIPAPAGLPMACVQAPYETGTSAATWPARSWLSWASRLGVLGTAWVALLLLRREMPGQSVGAGVAAMTIFSALTFYPVWKGHQLGQIQVFMNLALAVALLNIRSRPAISGVLVGLCCLLKPQCVIFLLWGALRREAGFCAGLLLVFAAGTAAAAALYGVDLYVQYFGVLRVLSQTGEVFWANQSLNGVLNRWLETGAAAVWVPGELPVYNPIVRWGTQIGALAVFAAALLLRPLRGSHVRRDLDFAAMLAAVTIASPVAWEHHYGNFIAIFALLLGVTCAAARAPRWAWVALGFAFVSMGNAWLAPERIFVTPVAGLLGSHLWLGALVTLGMLVYWRAPSTNALRQNGPTALGAPVFQAAAVDSSRIAQLSSGAGNSATH